MQKEDIEVIKNIDFENPTNFADIFSPYYDLETAEVDFIKGI